MEKRVVLFLVLSLGIIFGYNFLMEQLGILPTPQTPLPSEQAKTDATGGGSSEDDNQTVKDQDQTTPSPSLGNEQKGSQPIQAANEKLDFIETPLLKVQLTNKGGEVKSWTLKKYLTQNSENPQPVELMYPEGHFPGPLALKVENPELNRLIQESLYTVERDFQSLDEQHPIGKLIYTFHSPDQGILVKKTLTFHVNSYVVDVNVQVEGLPNEWEVELGTNFGLVEWGQGFIGLLGPAWMIGGTLEKETPETELIRQGDVKWIALQDKYFISVMIPQNASGITARKEAEKTISAGVQFTSAKDTSSHTFRLYAGPKQFDILKGFGIGLEDTIDFGWFIYGSWTVVKAVAKPLFYVLRFLYDYTQNYGVAIVLLTCGIKLLFVPLQYKSYKSMQGMQKIQPKVAALQTKFKDDREKLNKELIKLYKEHKVNPVGGCLPMVLQMPAFVSLFNILYMTVDLRKAPFILWINDLSVQDPYYVLPVLMGASMVIQQKIMPTTMDPTQAKMMLILPVFMTFLFVTFPAGLVLYWLTNNVLTILQQFITDRYIFKRPTFTQATSTDEANSQEGKDANPPPKKKKE